jgi:Trypsin-like peptidase domain
MFAAALQTVEKYTFPLIVLQRLLNGEIVPSCGTFIVVNREGWFLTAYHIVQLLEQANANFPLVNEFLKERASIENSTGLTPNQKRKHIRRLEVDMRWVANQSTFLVGLPGKFNQCHYNPLADLAIGRLEPFDPVMIRQFPVFKNPSTVMLPGTSLCRLGFPFHQIQATFNESTNQFTLADGVLPVPRFPNDGIHTRMVLMKSEDGMHQAKYLETSSPGLRGQSGGPIFDKDGHVWALQSRTQHLPLGFAPTIKHGNKEITEHQFMHVGWASHVEEIVKLFQQHNVSFELSS